MEDKQKKLHSCPHNGCTASFTRPYRLTDHMYSAHTNVKAYACKEEGCGKSYSNKSHLIRHINSVHKKVANDVIYSCPTCMKSYVNRQNLKRHIKIHQTSGTSYSCDFCRAVFKRKTQLKAHLYQHTGIKSFSCEFCPKDFVTYYEKKRHLRHHKKYGCSHCELVFEVWSKYQKHLKTEHYPKEYICNECNRSFKKRCHIVRHIKIHDVKQVVYFCSYENCHRSYTSNNNLKAHILTNHFKIKFECYLCKAQLSSKAVLDKHIKAHVQCQEISRKGKKSIERKKRKDLGSVKGCTAMKLAGINICESGVNIATDVTVN
ncbi:transcription factor IIIA-like [Ostrinia furnacalis]|uniref:transcription factor IIIA-like n=1 Tax=Ostrinia furnacalis TaxID=93504 RepID=UPI00103BD3A3|nr:transcription factor IIIA-like [Ostrinia furnacalis]